MNAKKSFYPADLQITKCFFWCFILLHILFWTIGPALTRNILPHDTLEGISWGMQWQWGYNKHPFATAWLSAGFFELFQHSQWSIYFLSQLAVAGTLLCVWRLASYILPPVHALLAALVLDGALFYNINSFNFTPDTLQSPLWALTALVFYRALNTQKISYWLGTGFLAALCLVTKYQALLLLMPMFFFCLINNKARKSFNTKGIYLAGIAALIAVSPHIFWLWQNNWITLYYAANASTEYTQYRSHFFQPLIFMGNVTLYSLGMFFLLWPFFLGKKAENQQHSTTKEPHFFVAALSELQISAFNWQFLLFLGLGPLLLTLILCILSGEHYPIRWATPYFFLFGILAIAALKPQISSVQLKQFMINLVLFSSLLWTVRIGLNYFYPREQSDAWLPNQKIAQTLTDIWHEHYSSPLPYLAGSHYLVATVLPYLPEKTLPFFSWDRKENPWLNEEMLNQKGGIFIWDNEKNYAWDASSKFTQLPPDIKKRYPQLQWVKTYIFYRETAKKTPLRISIGLLPPRLE